MKLSVIIPCYNAVNTLEVQLQALTSQRWVEPWEVIVADNGSTDGSMNIVKRFYGKIPNLRIVDASARKGQPYALNMGAKMAKGESLAFADADDEVGKGWVAAIGDALSQHDFVACRFDLDRLNTTKQRASRKHSQESGLQRLWYFPYLPHAGGGTLGVKKSLYEKANGFDEDLPYLHDTDFCIKLQMAGTQLHFAKDAVMHIRMRHAGLEAYRQARNYAEFNILLAKNYAPPQKTVSVFYIMRAHVKGWAKFLVNTPKVLYKGETVAWWGLYGRQIGRLRGSVKHMWVPV